MLTAKSRARSPSTGAPFLSTTIASTTSLGGASSVRGGVSGSTVGAPPRGAPPVVAHAVATASRQAAPTSRRHRRSRASMMIILLQSEPLALEIESFPREAEHLRGLFDAAAASSQRVAYLRPLGVLDQRGVWLVEADDDLGGREVRPLGCDRLPAG